MSAAGRMRESNRIVVFSMFYGPSVFRIGEDTAQRRVDVVKGCKFSPIAVIEGIGSRVTEKKTGIVNVGTDW